MTQNSNVDFKIINQVDSSFSSLLFFYDDDSFFNEISYLSNGLFRRDSGSKKSPQIIFNKMFGNPFLFYIQRVDDYSEVQLINNLDSFFQSNKILDRNVLYLSANEKINFDQLGIKTGVRFKKVDN